MAHTGGEPDSTKPLTALPKRTVRTVVPITSWLPHYDWRGSLAADGIAGVTLAALLIPESLGYAGVAGVPPEVGLYAALGALLAYLLTGGVSILVVGPASAVAALSASIVAEFRGDTDPIALTAALAITTGILLVAAGALRLGWIVNFISRPVLEAFVAGLSISIMIGQTDGLVGIELHGESALAKLWSAVTQVGSWDGTTVAIGFGTLVVLLVLERWAERVPAAVLVVVAGIVLVKVFDLAAKGVAVVGEIPQGLPSVAVPSLSATRWVELAAGSVALLLVGFSEGFASADSVASTSHEQVDPDQELVASGAANVAAGMFGGMAVSGSLSKSAASQKAGARSQLANLTAAAVVLATLLFLAPAFRDLPEPVLAGVVIVAVMHSADPRRVLKLWPVNRLDFVAGAATFLLVLSWETLPAMAVGVVVSLAFLVRRASFPDVVPLQVDPATGVFHRTATLASDAPDDDGRLTVLRFEAPLVYANARRLDLAVRAALDRRPDTERLVIDGEMLADLDATGAEMLEQIDEALVRRDVVLVLARVHDRARAQIARSGLADRFADRLPATLDEATRGQGR